MDLRLPYRAERGLDALLGLEILELTEELARGQLAVRDELKQLAGLVHGGVYACVAETLASVATGVRGRQRGQDGDGALQPDELSPADHRRNLHAEARRKHRGRSTWVWRWRSVTIRAGCACSPA